MNQKAPLSAKDVRKGLKAAGFTLRPQKSTSHEHWVKTVNQNGKPHLLKVTVDGHHEPFSNDLTKSMARQAGMTEKQFRELCSKDGQKKAKRGFLDWLKA